MIVSLCDSRLRRMMAALALAGAAASAAADDRIVVGPNTNVLGGPQALTIDPFFVRGDVLGKAQNEPSCGMSPRNPRNIICGMNDYRMIDVPGVSITSEVRDAWLGVAQSTDGGDTWESTLHPGFFLDPAPHVLKAENFRAAADPTVRTGPAGLALYSGIAFSGPDRDEGAVFMSTFIDLNNRENDRMPFKFVRTVIIDRGNRAQFIDKPWFFVEASAGTCSFQVPAGDGTTVSQTIPASTIHMMYSIFVGNSDQVIKTKEMYAKSTDCGATFGKPIKVSESVHVNNGASIAKPLAVGSNRVYGVWRRFNRPNDAVTDAIVGVVSNDNGSTWTKANVVAEMCPFDLNTKKTQFRATAFPSMTADGAGRAYVLWADRGRDTATGACNPFGKARMMMSTSTDGIAWAPPQQVVPSATDEHQIWPTIAFTAGKLVLAWVDFKEDASGVFGQFVDEREVLFNSPPIRHTGDVRAAMADPGASPNFLSDVTKVSRYLKGVGKVNGVPVVGQIQWNAVNKRWARRGDVPFDGDYIDIGTYSHLPPDPQAGRPDWTPNNGQVPMTPTVLIVWTDNRDMRRIPGPENLEMTDPPPVPYVTPLGLSLPPTSIYDPAQQRPLCTPGFNNYATGTFNQNVYAAQATREFVASSPGNNKTLATIQRAFVVVVRNDGDGLKQFQEVASQPAGGFASFDQFDTTKHSIVVTVPRHSSVARTVFVTPNPASGTPLDPDAVVPVTVTELVGGTPGQATTIFLNSDKSAPEINGPEINGSEVYTPEINGPEINGQGVLAPEINGPEINGNEVDAGEILSLGVQTPEINGPEINGPEINGGEIDGPEINGSALDTGAVTDIVYNVTGKGNTTAQVKAKAFVHGGPPAANYQVIVRRRYPVASVDESCMATTVNVSKVAVSIINSDVSKPEINGSSLDTASFFVAPGETVDFVIRVRTATAPSPAQLEALADAAEILVQQEAVNTAEAQQGVTEPPVFTSFLSIADSQLPPGVVGIAYTHALQASGGKGALTWSLLEGGTGLPPGLTFGAGSISGTPTTAGTFTFTVEVQDSSSPAQVAVKAFALVVTESGKASLAFATQPSDTGFGQAISPAPSVKAVSSTGTPVSGVPVTIALGSNPTGATLGGALTATTGLTGVAVFPSLTVSKAGAGYTLVASAGGYVTATSLPFGVGGPPDLVVPAMTHSPTAPTTETMATFTAVVKNAGTGPAGPSTLLFQIGDETPGAPGTLFGVPSLAAGETYAVERQMTLAVAQTYVNTATADFTGAVAESNEANNTKTDTYAVFPPAPKPLTFVVSNTGDSGPGSLRQALLDSNARVGLTDTILFDIPGPAPHLITPLSPLPAVDDAVVIDAPPTGDCFVGAPPTVEIDGVSAGPASGLVVNTGGVVIRGLSITRFALSGIALGGAGGSVVECSYLGLAPDGVTAKGNGDGIRISASANNTIGGPSAAVRNVISGNSGFGIDIEAGATGNSVQGNFIGTNAAGTAARPNATGLRVSGAGTVIGGVTTQPGTGAGNVISGNTTEGIHVCGTVLSGGGCPIGGPGGSGAVVQGNIIGLDANGSAKVGNRSGVRATNAAVQVGGTAIGARNVISGNDVGVALSNSGSIRNTVIQGNFIGTDVNGTLNRGNGTGVSIGSAPGTLVGGSGEGTGNIISGNDTAVSIGNISHRALDASGAACPGADATCYSTVVQGNLIGLGAANTGALGNGGGIVISSITPGSDAGQLIGGFSAAARNVISASRRQGVLIEGSAATGNAVLGNYIGTNAAGDASKGNTTEGVLVRFAGGNTIGGPGAGNVVSGNAADGIHLESVNGSTTTIQGNRIGTNAAGTAALGNGVHGITAISSSSLQIGGASAAERNLVSGNGAPTCPGCGIGVMLVGTNGSFVQGNFIGTDATGSLDLGNQRDGVWSSGSSDTIGGAAAGAGNLIVGNGGGGVVLSQASQNVVQGNLIGTNGTGALLGNGVGIGVFGGTNNTIGGATAGARNVISANRGSVNPGTSHGVMFASGGSGNVVLGNLIGLHPNGLDALGNDGAGIQFNAASGNVVGGTTAAARNVISANTGHGIEIFNATNTVTGNYVGTDESGTLDRGNGGQGVAIGSASGNTVGGAAVAAQNVIAFNGGSGIWVGPDAGAGNALRLNSIRANVGLGIDLVGPVPGVTANDRGDGDTGPNDLQNFPVLDSASSVAGNTTIEGTLDSTAATTFTLDFYASGSCDASGNGEGAVYLGSTTVTTSVDGLVSFTATFAVGVAPGDQITATATAPNGSTSEFSACRPAAVSTATHMGFVTQPSNTQAGSTMSPAVQVAALDDSNRVDPTVNFWVELLLETNPASGTLSGSIVQPAVNGVATFPDLSIDKAGSGYTLRAVSYHFNPDIDKPNPPVFPEVVSASFDITSPSTTDILLTAGVPGTASNNQSFNETRAVDVTVLTEGALTVASMKLAGLHVNAEPGEPVTALVGARIYSCTVSGCGTGTGGTLIAAGNVTIGPGRDQVVVVPVSAVEPSGTTVLSPGTTYRVGFWIATTPSGRGSGNFLIPTGWSLDGTVPYTESTGKLRLERARAFPADVFPTNVNLAVPQITLSVLQ